MENESIEILIVIDTAYVIANYPNPSQNPNQPTGIDNAGQYMIASDGRITGPSDINVYPNERIRFRGISIEGNADDAVIVYKITHWPNNQIFNTFIPHTVKRTGAVVPAMGGDGLPAVQQSLNFLSINSMPWQKATGNIYICFALYVCNDGSDQTIYGYYYFEPVTT